MARVSDLVGAITANVYMILITVVFVARMLGWPVIGRRIGLASSLILIPIPLAYLFSVGLKTERSVI